MSANKCMRIVNQQLIIVSSLIGKKQIWKSLCNEIWKGLYKELFPLDIVGTVCHLEIYIYAVQQDTQSF